MQQDLINKLRSLQNKYKNESINQQAYSTVLNGIKQLVLIPGHSYLEREIASALQISRTPVRETFSRLEMEDWGKIVPRRGFKVEPIRATTISEISDIMTDLDGLTAQLAVPNMTASIIEQLEKTIKLGTKAMNSGDFGAYIKIDDQFHNLIKQRCPNKRLINLTTVYSDQMFRARLFTISKRQRPEHSIREHKAIIAALKIGDAKAVRQLVEFHRRKGSQEIIQILQTK